MKNKYYTPKIEEFKVGFEYEILGQANQKPSWKKVVFDLNHHTIFYPKTETTRNILDWRLRDGDIRVKCLDQSDIEECGFVVLKSGIEISAQKLLPDTDFKFYELDYDTDDNRLVIEEFVQSKMINKKLNSDTYDSFIIFSGYVKNKSQLLDLLSMLNVK